MNTATQLTTKNNAWLTVGKATWVAFWFLVALAVKASIILLAIVGKIFVLLMAAIFSGENENNIRSYDPYKNIPNHPASDDEHFLHDPYNHH